MMNKTLAITIFGSSKELAKALDVTPQAIYQWEDDLPQITQDRVVGAAIRQGKSLDDIFGEPKQEVA